MNLSAFSSPSATPPSSPESTPPSSLASSDTESDIDIPGLRSASDSDDDDDYTENYSEHGRHDAITNAALVQLSNNTVAANLTITHFRGQHDMANDNFGIEAGPYSYRRKAASTAISHIGAVVSQYYARVRSNMVTQERWARCIEVQIIKLVRSDGDPVWQDEPSTAAEEVWFNAVCAIRSYVL